MAHLIQDLRHSARQLIRKPIFTATAVLTLAVGMGVNAVAFTLVNGVLFKGYAMRGIPNTGRILTTPGGDESGYASLSEYERFEDATDGALDIAAEGRSTLAWKHDGGTDTAWVLYVTRQYFSLITPPVIAGQLRVDHAGGAVSGVIGERFWRDKLGSPSITGLMLRLNDVDVAVAGVIAESWTGPAGLYSPDVWLPLDDLGLFSAAAAAEQRENRWLFVMGRLRDGATPARVQTLVQGAAAQMTRDWPETHRDRGASFRMFDGVGNSEVRGIAYGASIGMGIIGLVLLLACFNVANLLLARAVERERDMAVRAALGAKPARLMRLVVTEGFVIAVMSGGLALMLAWWTQSLMTTFAMPIEQPQHINMTPDARVVAFVAVLIVIAGVLPGLWPALSAARLDLLRVLGSQGASSAASAHPSRLRRWLMGAQIAGSTMFLAIAGLFMQSYSALGSFDAGFARDHLVLADFDPGTNGFDAARSSQYVKAFGDRVRALPGVVDVALIDRAPFFVGYDRTAMVWPRDVACETGNCRSYPVYAASAGYFGTMGITIAEGRELANDAARGEVVINGSLARTLFPNGGAAGQTLRIGEAGESVIVVGVTGATRTRGLDRETPVLFVPMTAEHFGRSLTLVARTAGPASTLVRPIQEAARIADPTVAGVAVKTMEQRMGVQLWPFRTLTWLFTICGSLALVLATAGLAGIVIHAVNRRVREFGVRLSVGATPRDLMRDVLRGSVVMLVPGITIGLLLAAAAARLVRFVFIGVNVLNPATYAIAALVQIAIVLVACLAPALRASRVDPLVALRTD
jgi:predicted permease